MKDSRVYGKDGSNGREKRLGPQKEYIHSILNQTFGNGLSTEHLGIPGRRFRFDWAVPELKLAIEYEGIFGRGRSRHTTQKGYSKDCEKYNLAAIHGWRVLRYTATTYRQLEDDLKGLNQIL